MDVAGLAVPSIAGLIAILLPFRVPIQLPRSTGKSFLRRLLCLGTSMASTFNPGAGWERRDSSRLGEVVPRDHRNPTRGYDETLPILLGLISDLEFGRDSNAFIDDGLFDARAPADDHVLHDD